MDVIPRPLGYRNVARPILQILKRLTAARARLYEFFRGVLRIRGLYIAELKDELIHFGHIV
jgi:hypothetical protein